MTKFGELIRKIIHLSSLSIPIGYLFLPRDIVLTVIIPIAAFLLTVDLVRFSNRRFRRTYTETGGYLLKEAETQNLAGCTYLLISSVACVLLFDKMVAIAALFFLILGDPVASFIGRRIGRIKILGQKTLEGSLACFLTCLVIASLIPKISFYAIILGALAATVVELLSLRVDDNLLIPLSSGLVIHVVEYL